MQHGEEKASQPCTSTLAAASVGSDAGSRAALLRSTIAAMAQSEGSIGIRRKPELSRHQAFPSNGRAIAGMEEWAGPAGSFE